MNKKHVLFDFIALLGAGILVFIDQWTKHLVTANLEPEGKSIAVWEGVFRIVSHKNTGAVWGIMSDKTVFLSIFTVVLMAAVLFFYFRINWDCKRTRILKIICILVTAGAIGNFIDRITLHYVVDFLYFELIDFPVFNVADCYITVSTFLMLILVIFYFKDEDFEQIWPKKS